MSAAVDFFHSPAEAPAAGAALSPVGRPRLALVPSGAGASDAGRVGAAVAPTPARPGLRVTARGKVAVAAAVIVLGLGLLGVARASAPRHPISSAPAGVVAVQPGDTLWSIAERVAPARDPRDTIADLRALNQLGTVELTPGQILRVG